MASNIYALLVGIDKYASPVTPLEGCVNDVLAIEEYLQSRLQKEGWNLHLRTLKDSEATRQGIIDGFREHLCQAGSNDVALFHYSGHGSQENAPKEFWDIEPDRLNETLVCYDSRQQGKRDLADKELAKLISEVAEKNPQIALILDCCHSGAGSRDPFQETAVRENDKDERSHTLEEYIFSKQEIDNLIAGKKASGWSLPKGKHILFASCQNSEKAKEFVINGEKRGAFSYFLTETLKKAKGNLTYRDLFKQINASVRSKYNNQSPQLEAIDSKDLELLFLGGAINERHPYYTVSHHKKYGWVIEGGAVHGVPGRDGEETMHLAIFPIETQGQDLRKLSNKIAEAKVSEVLPQLSKIEVNSDISLDFEQTFKAVITSLPLPPKTVNFAGDAEGIKLLQKAIQTIEDGNQPSLYVREVNDNETADFKVFALKNEYIITRPADGVPLVAPIQEYTKENAVKIIQRLEHISRWTNISELSSPANSQINADDIKLEIHHNSEILSNAEVRLNYYQNSSGKWSEPAFKVKLKNTSSKTLYCALLDLTEQFSIFAGFFEAGYIKLDAGEETWVFGGDTIDANVPQALWERGITDYQDIFKLIVCTSEFDARLLEQDKLDLPHKKDVFNQRGDIRNGTLNRLMSRVQSRDLSRSKKVEESDDWVTSQIVIRTHRPIETTTVPNSGNGVSLGAGVLLKAHSQLKAEANLTNISSSSRNIDNNNLPPLFRENPSISQPFGLTSSRGIEPPSNALELRDVDTQTIDTVTRENPLKLIVDTYLAPEEKVLPIAYDDGYYLPLGVGYSQNGRTEIRIERLPEPVKSGERDIKSAFQIYFQKVGHEKLGLEYTYPHLAIANIAADESVSYELDIEKVKQQVQQAENIVLFIHGITGETETLLPCMQRAKIAVEGKEKPLIEAFDLILAFDYENLHTSIEETARLLKQRLEAVGLGANHGKNLQFIAHSMGGLVSRWFIEREGGNQIVNHLIMPGTPNAGSPLATVEEWAISLLTLGLNGLSTVVLPAKLLVGLLAAIEEIDITLDQMQPKSNFLKNLAASPDPGIPYSIIAGDNSIASENNRNENLQQILQKLKIKSRNAVFSNQPNDDSVSVESITYVNSNRVPQPQIYNTGSNHMSYFSDVEGLNAIATALMGNIGF
ncbi:MAG: caspase family protein [Cyanobacteria bacterium P01_D01_bin.116]